jgi:hypothetical protein
MAAARVIQEELLKDLANRSELSDWFSREDTAPLPAVVVKKPNPKNVQNAEKIKELEEQIHRYVTIFFILCAYSTESVAKQWRLKPDNPESQEIEDIQILRWENQKKSTDSNLNVNRSHLSCVRRRFPE